MYYSSSNPFFKFPKWQHTSKVCLLCTLISYLRSWLCKSYKLHKRRKKIICLLLLDFLRTFFTVMWYPFNNVNVFKFILLFYFLWEICKDYMNWNTRQTCCLSRNFVNIYFTCYRVHYGLLVFLAKVPTAPFFVKAKIHF